MNKTGTIIVAGLIALSTAAGIARAGRYVVVNGDRLGDSEIMRYEMQCGSIADGEYWVNPSTGVWGYEGDPTPQGGLSGNCYTRRHKSLSEKGMLYSPWELLRDN
jgi:hypothetical protein